MLIFQLASGSPTFEDHWSRASALPLLAHAPRRAHLQVHPHLPQAPLLVSGVPVNRLAHSFLKCISDFCQPSASHFKTHTHTPERQERGKEVSGSPQTQRTSRGALTSLHCTQLPVFDYWLLWCLACTSAVGRRHCCLRSPCFQLSYLFFSFLHSFFLTLIWIFLTFSSFSPFNISLLPSNSHPCFSLFGHFHVIRTASFHLFPSRAISNNWHIIWQTLEEFAQCRNTKRKHIIDVT